MGFLFVPGSMHKLWGKWELMHGEVNVAAGEDGVATIFNMWAANLGTLDDYWATCEAHIWVALKSLVELDAATGGWPIWCYYGRSFSGPKCGFQDPSNDT